MIDIRAARALRRAVKVAGSATNLARMCGVTSQAVDQWLMRGRVPVARVLCIEQSTGVARHELRPDIYPPPVMSLAS
jgi:DNA-binding transcriptional regulator YdaS (Cro superfamily)